MKYFHKVFSLIITSVILLSSLNTVKVMAAPILDVVSTIVSTGTAPFDADDTAGNDSTSTNNIVRTFDRFINEFQPRSKLRGIWA